jgi:DNA-directed RNA polymerase specialized sigma24 family protein
MVLDAETLLVHGAWFANLARALVADEDELDDIVQRTYAHALAQRPQFAGNLGGRLGAIAREVARENAGGESVRVAREVAMPPPVDGRGEALERAELRLVVVESVLALDEPDRSAVILRFFEEQDVAGVARLTAADEDAVRARIRRGVLGTRRLLEFNVDDRVHGAAHEGVAARALLFVRLREIGAGRFMTSKSV